MTNIITVQEIVALAQKEAARRIEIAKDYRKKAKALQEEARGDKPATLKSNAIGKIYALFRDAVFTLGTVRLRVENRVENARLAAEIIADSKQEIARLQSEMNDPYVPKDEYLILINKEKQTIDKYTAEAEDLDSAVTALEDLMNSTAWLDNEQEIRARSEQVYNTFLRDRFGITEEAVKEPAQISAPKEETVIEEPEVVEEAVETEEETVRPAKDHRAAFLAHMAQAKAKENKTTTKKAEALKESFLQRMAALATKAVSTVEETVTTIVTTVKETVVKSVKKTAQELDDLKNSFLARVRRAQKTA